MTGMLLTTLGLVVLMMTLLWAAATLRKDVSIVDPFWGAGFVGVAWVALAWNWPATQRVLLLATLTTVWGCRLYLFLTWRKWGEGEDRRYAAMRTHHGNSFWWISLATVFLLQAVLLWFISLPVQVAAALNRSSSLGWLDALGTVAWLVGMFFETTGDWQLARFKRTPGNSGRVLQTGLWRYTRHPNYFGDFCVWWGLYLIAAAGGAGATVLSPIVMSILLMKVSGAALLERTIGERRPEYAAYQARTNAFFPGPGRK